jgi:hypothetical protein
MGLFLFDFEFKVPCIRNREGKITSGRSANSRFRDTQGTKKKEASLSFFLASVGNCMDSQGLEQGRVRPEPGPKKNGPRCCFLECPARPLPGDSESRTRVAPGRPGFVSTGVPTLVTTFAWLLDQRFLKISQVS